eukprot:jgi/Mesvir1/13731/Mv06942-RA.1
MDRTTKRQDGAGGVDEHHWHASTSPAKAMGQHPGAYNGMDEVAARVAALQVSGQGHDFLPAGPGYFPGPGVGPWDWHAPTHPFRAGEYVQGQREELHPSMAPPTPHTGTLPAPAFMLAPAAVQAPRIAGPWPQQRLRGLALAYVAGVAGVPGGAYPWVPLGGGARYVAPARPAPNPNWQGGRRARRMKGRTRTLVGGRHPPPPWDASSPYDAMPLDSYFPWADGVNRETRVDAHRVQRGLRFRHLIVAPAAGPHGGCGAEDEGGSGPPPPPPPFAPLPDDMELANLLMAWYYAGFYTARYSKKHPLKR